MQYSFADNDATVELRGELTFVDHSVFRAMAARLLQTKAPAAVIDLGCLDFIDSAGLGMLLLVRDEAKRANRTLVLRHPVGQVKRIFDISKFETLFSVQP